MRREEEGGGAEARQAHYREGSSVTNEGAGGIDPHTHAHTQGGVGGVIWAEWCMEKYVYVCVWTEKYSCATALMERPEPAACWQMTCQSGGGEKRGVVVIR